MGVFVGASTLDYSTESFFDPSSVTGHFMTGNTLSVISNRISYIYNLNGPSFTVDTACSSSLVALNEAVKAINGGEIDTAIVAGVNALVSPFPFVGFSQATMLSPEGLCRAFDERGLGYVRSEGCLAFVLRRKDASPWPGQGTIASILDVGINADGKTVGMSFPSPDHQGALLHDIYGRAEIDLNDLAFVEAHGTGTRVGDPVEAQSIGKALAVHRSSRLPIGSVKTNIGHLEPASGLAGLAKACLALQNDTLPASLHFEQPNPDIDFEGLNLRVATETEPLDWTGKRRFAGVNSFGFGGTNAHVLLGDPDSRLQETASDAPAPDQPNAELLALSAKSREALSDLAGRYADAVQDVSADDLSNIQSAAWYRKPQFEEKLVVKGRDPNKVAEALRAFAAGESNEDVLSAKSPITSGGCTFVFSGNGSQWPGMGQAAYLNNSAFRSEFDRISAVYADATGVSLKEQLFSAKLHENLHLTSNAQPLLFVIQIALCGALKIYGLKPDFVLGHSIGEAAAAVVSGAMTLKDGAELVHHRSREQEAVAGDGTMAALVLPEDEARAALIEADCGQIEVAAVNSPKSISLSGEHEALAAFGRYARQNHLAFRKVDLDYPFHSSLIECVEAPFKKAVGELIARDGGVAFISTVTGSIEAGSRLNTQYWWRNLREPVQFKNAIETALSEGARRFIEIGPKPILQSYIRQTAASHDPESIILGSLTTQQSVERDPILDIVSEALLKGFELDEEVVFGENPDRYIQLPSYPWQNKSYRFEKTSEAISGLLRGNEHALLGWSTEDASDAWVSHIDAEVVPFLGDHEIDGNVIFPGAGYVEIAFAIGKKLWDAEQIEIRDMDIVQAMFLSTEHLTEVQTRYFPETGTFEVSSRRRLSGEDWALNAKGRIFRAVSNSAPDQQVQRRESEASFDADTLYGLARSFGMNYGPSFRRVKVIEKVGENACRVHLQDGIVAHDFSMHPAELDACFHGVFALVADKYLAFKDTRAYVPVHFDSIQQTGLAKPPATADITARRISNESVFVDFSLFDDDGKAVLVISGARFRAVSFGEHKRSSDLVFHYRQEPIASRPDSGAASLPTLERPEKLLLVLNASPSDNLISSHEVESRLLLEAAAQRLAIDVLRVLSRGDGVVSEQDFPVDVRLYLNALLNWLVHVEIAEETHPGEYGLVDVGDLPAFDLLIDAILREKPEEIAAATLLTRCRNVAVQIAQGKTVEFEPSNALVDHFRFGSPDAAARLEFAEKWIEAFIEGWPATRPLRVLDLAGSGLELAKFVLSKLPAGAANIVVADPETASAARLAAVNESPSYVEVLDASKKLESLTDRSFDLIVSSGRLHEFNDVGTFLKTIVETSRGKAQFAAVEPERSLLADSIFGLTEGWLEAATSDQFPLSKLRTDREWVSVLKLEAGFADVRSEQTIVRGHPASVIYGTGMIETRAPQHDDVEAPKGASSCIIVSGNQVNERACAQALSARLSETGVQSNTVFADESGFDTVSAATWQQVFSGVSFADADEKNVVLLFGAESDGADPVAEITRRCRTCIAIGQAGEGLDLSLFIIAPSGSETSSGEGEIFPDQAAVWAFSRVLENEFPNLKVRRLDVAVDEMTGSFADCIVEALSAPSKESDLIASEQGTSAPRVVSGFRNTGAKAPESVALEFDYAGSLSTLSWRPSARTLPGDDDVEIEVSATGLNFRDVMWSLGMLPEEALEDGYGGPSLGLECSGRIVRAGGNVSHLKVGDPVVAFTSAGFSSHVTVPAFAAIKLEDDKDLIGAATIPVAFLTAYYALVELGALKSGQWILLHGGAGGVGLAALQIAKSIGARVIATAGTPEKRDLLTALGADHVLDSRSLNFSLDVMSLTDHVGVHVVLNSLAGEAMERSIQVVRPFGRFLELGKRDYYENTKIGLRPFRKNVSYFGIDVDQLLSHDLGLANEMINAVFRQLGSEDFSPLPYRLFEGSSVQDAFRLMQRSGHIGKILVTPPSTSSIRGQDEAAPVSFDADGIHVVVGGLGGFGGEVARWLADHGAKKILLTNRSGAVGEQHKALIAQLAQNGVEVRSVRCDVTDKQELHETLEELRLQAPIKSVFHTAMVLDDGLMTSLDEERFEKVLAPKVLGAKYLDELTRKDHLDQFVLFSSMTTMLGNPGQANYVAANGYLEGLARARRQKGLPGLAIGWGAIGDVGFLARNAEVSKKLSKHLGSSMIVAREGLDVLTDVMGRDQGRIEEAVIHIGRFDWATTSQALPVMKQNLFRHLALTRSNAAAQQNTLDLVAMITGKDDKEAKQIVCDLLARELSEILRLPVDDIEPNRPLADFGMDSLMGLELRMGVQKRFNIEIPLVTLSGGTNIEDFADLILNRVRPDEGAKLRHEGADFAKDELVAQHVASNLTEDQKAALGNLLEQEKLKVDGLLQ